MLSAGISRDSSAIPSRLTLLGVLTRRVNRHNKLAAYGCKCGNIKVLRVGDVKQGLIRSCGCLRKELVKAASTTHGLTHTPTYGSWYSMKGRCKNSKNNRYRDYGGRGITYVSRWESFDNFLADMGERPAGMTLDRKNNDGPYSPKNCRWATSEDQRRNKRKRSVRRHTA
jgi:hypothetical protein